jgi:hypothetical protein
MKGDDKNWPAWYSDPKTGKSAIFECAEDVPNGWTTGAEGRSAKDSPKPVLKAAEGGGSNETKAEKQPIPADLDAHGHAYDPALHAATQSKTKDGLWRMKVGVSRPDPAPGFPKPPLDL